MSIKSILPLAATAAVATLALTGCTQNNAAPADSSATQAPAASAPAGSGEASATQAPAAPSSAPSAPAAQLRCPHRRRVQPAPDDPRGHHQGHHQRLQQPH